MDLNAYKIFTGPKQLLSIFLLSSGKVKCYQIKHVFIVFKKANIQVHSTLSVQVINPLASSFTMVNGVLDFNFVFLEPLLIFKKR